MRHAQRGAGMVEFVVAAMALLLLFFGIIEVGRVVYTYHTVSDAARLGSRWAMVRGSSCIAASCPAATSDVQTYVRAQAPLIDTSNMTVSTTWPGNSTCTVTTGTKNAAGCLVSVNVTYPFHFALPFISTTTVNLSSTSQMIISQ